MGNKLSAEQWEFYLQVRDALFENKIQFSKNLLKNFVHWIFKEFPHTTLDEVRFPSFWEKIQRRMTFLQSRGEGSVERFFVLLILIQSTVKKPKKKSKVKTPVAPSLLPVPHLPHSPKPAKRGRDC